MRIQRIQLLFDHIVNRNRDVGTERDASLDDGFATAPRTGDAQAGQNTVRFARVMVEKPPSSRLAPVLLRGLAEDDGVPLGVFGDDHGIGGNDDGGRFFASEPAPHVVALRPGDCQQPIGDCAAGVKVRKTRFLGRRRRKHTHAIARNDESNMSSPCAWSRFDWAYDGDDLYYCQSAYAAESEEAALDSEPADAEDLEKGCSGFPWSQLTPQ